MPEVDLGSDGRLTAGLPFPLREVLKTRGSTPRKAGARMLVHRDGTQAGTLGGSSTEAEVRRQALRLLAAGEPAQVFAFELDGDSS